MSALNGLDLSIGFSGLVVHLAFLRAQLESFQPIFQITAPSGEGGKTEDRHNDQRAHVNSR